MKTKADFQAVIDASISNYPTAAQFAQAKDPRLLASLDAMATMLAMLSAELDVVSAEPFTKARDMTVLADASVKGVLPFGNAARVRLLVENASDVAVVINSGRRVLDSQGRSYIVDTGATIAAAGSGYINALQKYERVIEHTITAARPFYKVEIPAPEAGRHIAGVRIVDTSANEFEFIPEFVNVGLEQRAFHIEISEDRTIYALFGANGIAGYQPVSGEALQITVTDTDGNVEIASGSNFAFEYSYSIYEAGVTIKFDSLLSPGRAPHDIATLREICKFPSIYNASAVFMGNFDFLIRRQLTGLRFLSVWNEQREEEVRGADVDNINALFIAAEADDVDQATLEANIASIIRTADDSYRQRFVTVVHSPIPVVIAGQVSPIYDFAAVANQVREVVAAEYGPDSAFSKRGQGRVLHKRLYDILKTIQAFQGTESDIAITVTDPVENILPEHYRYISTASLTVTITEI